MCPVIPVLSQIRIFDIEQNYIEQWGNDQIYLAARALIINVCCQIGQEVFPGKTTTVERLPKSAQNWLSGTKYFKILKFTF